MTVTPIKTPKITNKSHNLITVIKDAIKEVKENSLIVITSKIVSLCEGSTVKLDEANKDELIKKASQYYIPKELNAYGISLTITNNILIPSAGIDETNAGERLVLWPKNAQKSANMIRKELRAHYGVKNLGIIISDSTVSPLHWGVTGIAIAYSGFKPLKNYIGKKDLFGREMKYSTANIKNMLATAACVTMGEAHEQTPLALIEDVPFVEFVDKNPTKAELQSLIIDKKDDVYATLLDSDKWVEGGTS